MVFCGGKIADVSRLDGPFLLRSVSWAEVKMKMADVVDDDDDKVLADSCRAL